MGNVLLYVNSKTLSKMMKCSNWDKNYYYLHDHINEGIPDNQCICEIWMNSLSRCNIIFKDNIYIMIEK